jgi:hypothetical protein
MALPRPNPQAQIKKVFLVLFLQKKNCFLAYLFRNARKCRSARRKP